MRDFMDVIKALADENRVRALMALRGRELCVCPIIELLGLAPSTVSRHMSILKQARLVVSRKQGRWAYYRLAADSATPDAREALVWLQARLSTDQVVRADTRRLLTILRTDPETLCRSQCQARGEKKKKKGRHDGSYSSYRPGNVRFFNERAGILPRQPIRGV